MKLRIAATLFASVITVAIVGCEKTEKASIKQETKITTPEGTKTTTTTTDVKTTGEKPPGTTP